MKILYVATSFPEPQKGATIYTDLAEELYLNGHQIVVAVAEQRKNKLKTSFLQERGFPVLRIVVGNFYDVNIIRKGITQMLMPSIMKKSINRYLANYEFDLILFESPPITNIHLISWLMKKYQCKSYLMLKDIFPQNAVDLNIIKKSSPVYYYYKSLEKKLYKVPTYIGVMSEENKNYIENHNRWLDRKKLELFPNTKKVTNYVSETNYHIRESLNIPKEAIVFLLGGNMGKPQYVEGLIQVVKRFKNDESLYFLFVGRGTDRYKLEEVIEKEDISNAKVIENLPRKDYEELIKECDVGLISLHPNFTIPNYPSRILSYMEYAKPILALTDTNTDIKDLILKIDCGYWAESGSLDDIIFNIEKLKNDEKLKEKGMNGRKYFEKNFHVRNSVKILEGHID